MSGGFFVPPVPIPFMEIPTAIIALGMLGFELAAGAKDLMYMNQRVNVQHVLVNESGLRIGVRVDTKTGLMELLVNEEELREKEGIEIKQFEETVQKNYQYTQVMNRLKAEGFTIVEEKQEANETVKVVVRRWR